MQQQPYAQQQLHGVQQQPYAQQQLHGMQQQPYAQQHGFQQQPNAQPYPQQTSAPLLQQQLLQQPYMPQQPPASNQSLQFQQPLQYQQQAPQVQHSYAHVQVQPPQWQAPLDVVGQKPAPEKTAILQPGPFSSGLYSCFSECSVCCLGLGIPCVLYGDNYTRLHGQGFWGACLLYCFCPVLTGIFAADTRRVIRTKYSCIFMKSLAATAVSTAGAAAAEFARRQGSSKHGAT